MWELDCEEGWALKNWCFWTVVLEKTLERSALGFLWREWCWSWNSSTLATSCQELTDWKSLWCWEGLRAGGEGDDRGWDGWMASLAWWTRIWVNSGGWWWTGSPGVLQFMGSQRVGHDWATELYDYRRSEVAKCFDTIWQDFLSNWFKLRAGILSSNQQSTK